MPIFPHISRSAAARKALAARESLDTQATCAARRHFFDAPRFQTYATFFPLWGGWASAGHCLTETGGLCPPFASGRCISWPDGLDAALIGCTLPDTPPPPPYAGQRLLAEGFPAGSRHLETRAGAAYLERMPGQWIVQMNDGEEPVVTGMSGGPVRDAASRKPLGILITRNSPADLDADGDADQSYDFIALAAVWTALRNSGRPKA